MKATLLWPLVLVTLALTGCSDQKSVSKSNFQRVINDQLKTEKLCIAPLTRVLLAGNADNGFPVTVTMDVAELNMLAKEGLLSTTPTTAVPQISFERKPVPATTYSLTDKGKQSYSGPPNYQLCYGSPEATNVTEYTEPADSFGAHVTQVRFDVGVRDYAAWALDPALQKRFGTVNPKAKGIALLKLTSEGWKVTERGIGYKNDGEQ